MTLYNVDTGQRFCEWDAPHPKVIEEIFRELEIKWTEIIEVEVTSASSWKVWEIQSGKLKRTVGRP
jgi:hypothetical protein